MSNIISKNTEESAIAIGNFDGFHLGHKKIIDTLIAIAGHSGLTSHILTFTPNPKVYFKRESELIQDDAQRRQLLEGQGVNRVSFIDFKNVVHMEAEEFLKTYLIDRYSMKYIVVGENFRFGKNRGGDTGSLQQLSMKYGFGLEVVKPRLMEGIKISSSYIRDILSQGRIEECNRLLGRLHSVQGVVKEGEKVGRELGFPTINLEPPGVILPEGVFQTMVKVNGDVFPSATYIGARPTFTGKHKKVETHIFDFNRKIYGQHVTIFFLAKVREDIKFNSRENLVEQIKKDIEKIKKVDKGAFF